MRVHYDDQIVMLQPRGGVSRYFVELVRAFPQRIRASGSTADLDWRVVAQRARGRRRPWAARDSLAAAAPPPGEPPAIPRGATPGHLPPDLVLPGSSPDQARAADGRHRRRHDPRALAGPLRRAVTRTTPRRHFARRASAVVCISESTRRDLLRVYGPLEAIVEVVPLAVGANFRPRPAPDPARTGRLPPLRRHRGTYKDFAVALEAFASIRAEHPGLASWRSAAGGSRRASSTTSVARPSRDRSTRSRSRTTSFRRCTAPPGRSCSRRATKASAFRRSRRWRLARRRPRRLVFSSGGGW